MIDQEADDLAASVRHWMTQRGVAAREAEARALQWEAQCKQHRATIDALVERANELEKERGALQEETARLDARIENAQRAYDALRDALEAEHNRVLALEARVAELEALLSIAAEASQ